MGFYEGQEVMTRREKVGRVVSVNDDTVLVRFGGKTFEMKKGQLVDARQYRKAASRYSPTN